MCWNATSSIVSFCLGVLLSMAVAWKAIDEGKRALAVLALGWVWVVFMQLWEYFLWMSDKNNNQALSRYAYVFNIMQVTILGMIYLTFFTQDKKNRAAAFMVMIFYTFYMLYFSPVIGNTSPSCDGHLEYKWWKEIPLGGVVYLVSLIAIFLLLVRPLYWSVCTLSYILLLFLLSYLLFHYSVASMWCFFAVSVPVVSYLISLFIYF